MTLPFDFLICAWPVGSLAATSAIVSSKPSLVLVWMFDDVETCGVG